MEKILRIKRHNDAATDKRKGSVMPESGELLIGDYIAKDDATINGKKVSFNVWKFLIVRRGTIIRSQIPVGRFNRVFFAENSEKEQIEYSFDGDFVNAYLASDADSQQTIARCVIALGDVTKVKISDNNYWFASLNPKGYWEDADTLSNLIGEDLFIKVAPILFDEIEGSDSIEVVKTEGDTDKEGEGEGNEGGDTAPTE